MATSKRKPLKNPFATLRSKKEKEPFESVEPWRYYKDLKDGWPEEYYKELLTRIKKTTTSVLGNEDDNSKTVNIMMLGYVQSGKSSTINSIVSIFERQISRWAKSGYSDVSYTQRYNSYSCGQELDNIVFFDTMGLDGSPNGGILNEDIIMCINGEVEDGYQFNPRSKKRFDSKVLGKEIHCVMYCVDAESLGYEFIEPVRKKVLEIESELKITAQDRIVLVTKIDTICDKTKQDIKKIFHSKKVKTVVEMAAMIFKVSLNQVYPIKNYTDEVEIDKYTNIPLLLGLSKAVDFGIDYLLTKADQTRRTTHQLKLVPETE